MSNDTKNSGSATLNTGGGGFELDGQTYTYDTGVSDEEGGSQGTYDKGDINVDNRPKDISNPTRKRLGVYLSEVTRGENGSAKVTNEYPVNADEARLISTTDESGNPARAVAETSNQKTFAVAGAASSQSDNYAVVSNEIKKGKSKSSGVGGNDLLRSAAINQQKTSEPVGRYVSQVLKVNRFGNSVYGATSPTSTSPNTDNKLDLDQVDSRYNPDLNLGAVLGENSLDISNRSLYSIERLASVGPTLMMRASGEVGANNPNFDPNSTSAAASALLPGAAQLGARVEQLRLSAKDVLESLVQEENVNYVVPSGLSWGSMNNTEDVFTGPGALGQQALSFALIAGLLVSIESIGALVGLGEEKEKYQPFDENGRYVLGKYMYQRQDPNAGFLKQVALTFSKEALGVRPTNYPFNLAVRHGVYAYFGIDRTKISSTIGASAGVRAYTDAGFSVVTVRGIIRSSMTIIDAFRQVKGNPLSAAKSALSIIDVIKSSKLIAACNVFAQLGDALLSIQSGTNLNENGKLSRIDAKNSKESNVPTSSPSRLHPGLTLAWAGQRSRSLLMMPTQVASLRSLSSIEGVNSTEIPTSKDSRSKVIYSSSGRIDPERVTEIENELDAEYVPFYFHDVRTNEIISFHAFLASLSDDYTAGYESIDAYGRVEPVRIYKNTVRSIGISFHIAATSSTDLEDMWMKINKLVTLVYPQYTAGKKLKSDDGYQFTQPFSQLIGASPLIRLRLGDLLKSNYSKFNLARLFGLGNDDFSLGKEKSNAMQVSIEDLVRQFKENVSNYTGKKFIPQVGDYPRTSDKPNSGPIQASVGAMAQQAGVSLPATGGSDPASTLEQNTDQMFVVKVMGQQSSELAICEVVSTYGTTNKSKINAYKGGLYLIRYDQLDLAEQTKAELVEKGVASDTFKGTSNNTNSKFDEQLGSFFNDDNAIVKSFKSTGGKGLAGFIDSIGFDWYDRVTWSTNGAMNGVVPKMCKVTLKFSPIHDISPGLDHFGHNRAPVYPVLNQSTTKKKG